ncbi:hypothetical protein GW17_00062474 [Ensete ventricosum]|nr:hypothetical protein GW17_00062474 [Ensete ventricosum]
MALELDILSSDSVDSLRAQLPRVNQRLDEVQKEFIKSKEELGESSKGSSPFVPQIQDKLISTNFRLPLLESSMLKPSSISSFDQLVKEFELNFLASSLPRPNAASLLSLSQGSEESLLKPSSISLFDQLVKEFELNFLASSLPRPNAASLLGLSQGSEESLV